MPQFLSILEKDQDKINVQLETYQEIANKNNILLFWDDTFDLRVNPDGSWNIFMLDLADIFKKDDTYPHEQLIETNSKARKAFLNELLSIKDEYIE